MYSRTRVTRTLLRFAVLALVACSLEPRPPIITRLAAFNCGNPACTNLGAQILESFPSQGLQSEIAHRTLCLRLEICARRIT